MSPRKTSINIYIRATVLYTHRTGPVCKGPLQVDPLRDGRTKSRVWQLFTRNVPYKSRFKKSEKEPLKWQTLQGGWYHNFTRGHKDPRSCDYMACLFDVQSNSNKSITRELTLKSQLLNCYVMWSFSSSSKGLCIYSGVIFHDVIIRVT